MGEYADDAVDRIIWGWRQYYRPKNYSFQRQSGDYKWRCSDRTVISMYDMEIAHIENAIKKCIEYDNSTKLKQLREVLAKKMEHVNGV